MMEFDKNTKYFLIAGWSLFLLLILISDNLYAGDNHVHIEQVNSGDDININASQVGTNNEIRFSIDHNNNTFNLLQYGANNKISWVPYWGSGKSWGGDVDGVSNTLNVEQHDGATYGGHIWGNSNQVDIYQHGTHTHYLDIHVDSVDHDIWQEGSGSHYSHIYYYNVSDSSNTSITQKGSGNHNARVVLRGNRPTTLSLLQDSAVNKTYQITQNCVTVGGCNISVTQQ